MFVFRRITFVEAFCLMLHCVTFSVYTGIFPEPDKDPVIQIANMVVYQGEKTPFIRNVFTLDSCAPILGSKVYSYKTEKELLQVGVHSVLISEGFSIFEIM